MKFTLNVLLIVLVIEWLPTMGNATWWKSNDDDPADGKCLVSKPDPKNKDGKPVMVWVDCDWINGRLVTRATTATVKPKTTTRPIATRPPGKCLAQSDVYKYKNGEPAWVWVECDWTSGRPKPITKKPASTTTAKPASSSTPAPSSPTPRSTPTASSSTQRPNASTAAGAGPSQRPTGPTTQRPATAQTITAVASNSTTTRRPPTSTTTQPAQG